MCKRYLALSAFIIGFSFYGCSSKPSEKEILNTIQKTLSFCGLEEVFNVKISGISKDSDNLLIVMAEISTSKTIPVSEQFSLSPLRAYKFTFRKYDKGWLIEKKEPLGELAPTVVDIYEFTAMASTKCPYVYQGRAKGSLSSMRAAGLVYYGDHKGKFPTDFKKDLIPTYLSNVPVITIGEHPKTDSIKNVDGWNGECVGVTNSGGWLYANDPKKPALWGNIVIDSDELSPEGKKWCMY